MTRARFAAFLVTLLAVMIAAPSIGNDFTYDDVPVVRDNSRIHTLGSPLEYLNQGYWPPPHSDLLYRPATVQTFALQWAVGDGRPWVFHVWSVVTYAAVVLAVFWLGTLVLPLGPAFAAAALFAAHPVHVEAIASVVGQSELLCTLFSISAVALYIRLRQNRAGMPARLSLIAVAALAALSKEQGFVVPGLLLLAEFTVIPGQWNPGRHRVILEAMGPALVVLLGIFVLRLLVLGGLGGGAQAYGIRDLDPGSRLFTFLALVPQWVRLLVWPAHLSVSYSPPEYAAAMAFGPASLLGFVLLVAAVALAWTARRTAPVVTLGLGWTIIAIAPVSNLLFTTGLIIAERTLFLPSVGVVLAVAGAWQWTGRRSFWRPAFHGLGLAVLAALIAVGAIRSARRQLVWKDNLTLQRQAVTDSPGGYRPHFMLGITLNGLGQLADAERHMLRAAALYDGDPRVFEELSHIVRRMRGCQAAVPFMRKALAIDSSLTVSRARLFYCQLETGDVAAARETALAGQRLGLEEFAPLLARAESLLGRISATSE